jgi:chromosomal replication initiator protein
VDLLLIDDVQFFQGKERFQEEFFHTFNALFHAHKQIVITSDRPPHEIGGLEKRLVSRFEWGLTTDIGLPDLETRLAILRKKQEDHAVKLDDDVLFFIASRIKSNIRRLEGALIQLVSFASVTGAPVTDTTAETLLGPILDEEASTLVSVEHIQRTVAEFYDIRLADMTSKRRPKNIAFPRQVAMYLCRKLTEYSSPAIAEHFNRNHATVLHAVGAVETRLTEDADFRREVNIIERKIKA